MIRTLIHAHKRRVFLTFRPRPRERISRMGSIILILYPPLFLSSLPVSLTKAQVFHRSWIVIPIFFAAFAVSRHGPQHCMVCSLAVFKQRDLYSPGFVQTVAHVQYSGQFPARLAPLSKSLSSASLS